MQTLTTSKHNGFLWASLQKPTPIHRKVNTSNKNRSKNMSKNKKLTLIPQDWTIRMVECMYSLGFQFVAMDGKLYLVEEAEV